MWLCAPKPNHPPPPPQIGAAAGSGFGPGFWTLGVDFRVLRLQGFGFVGFAETRKVRT